MKAETRGHEGKAPNLARHIVPPGSGGTGAFNLRVLFPNRMRRQFIGMRLENQKDNHE
jgi:hypothetical protein